MTKRYQLSPELVDGQHWTVVDTKEEICEAVKEWCNEYRSVGESFSVCVVDMTDEEVEALPDV